MSKFKFSVGPWNVHTGADSYGPEQIHTDRRQERIFR